MDKANGQGLDNVLMDAVCSKDGMQGKEGGTSTSLRGSHLHRTDDESLGIALHHGRPTQGLGNQMMAKAHPDNPTRPSTQKALNVKIHRRTHRYTDTLRHTDTHTAEPSSSKKKSTYRQSGRFVCHTLIKFLKLSIQGNF